MRAAVLALAACGSPAAVIDAPAPDAPALDAFALVTGRAHALDLRLDAQHVPSSGDQPFGASGATLRQPDGSWAPLTLAADGTFSFAMPDARKYRLRITADGGTTTELQMATPTLDYVGRYGFRYDRSPVPAGTTLHVSLPNAPATGVALVESTGIWGNLGRSGAEANTSFVLDWTLMPGMLDASAHDRPYAVIIDSPGTTPAYNTIVSSCTADVMMVAGANTMTCTLAPQPLDHCMHLRADFADEYARVTAALPTTISYPSQSWSWNIFAVPDPALGPAAPLIIAGVGYTTGPVNFDRGQTTYGMPYPDHAPLLVMTMQRYRTVTAPGATAAAALQVITQQYVAAAADCSTVTEASGTVAIAGVPALAGVPLATDNAKLTIDRTSDLDLSWQIAADGRADYWAVTLVTIRNSGGATVLAPTARWIVTDTHVAVDPALLAPGTSYLVQVMGFEGFANSASGDFNTVAYPQSPYGTSAQWSAIFGVAN